MPQRPYPRNQPGYAIIDGRKRAALVEEDYPDQHKVRVWLGDTDWSLPPLDRLSAPPPSGETYLIDDDDFTPLE